MLHEVQMLEGVRHPNIIAYKHTWIESAKLTEFGEWRQHYHILSVFS
jgi:hypothetical protein